MGKAPLTLEMVRWESADLAQVSGVQGARAPEPAHAGGLALAGVRILDGEHVPAAHTRASCHGRAHGAQDLVTARGWSIQASFI